MCHHCGNQTVLVPGTPTSAPAPSPGAPSRRDPQPPPQAGWGASLILRGMVMVSPGPSPARSSSPGWTPALVHHPPWRTLSGPPASAAVLSPMGMETVGEGMAGAGGVLAPPRWGSSRTSRHPGCDWPVDKLWHPGQESGIEKARHVEVDVPRQNSDVVGSWAVSSVPRPRAEPRGWQGQSRLSTGKKDQRRAR